MSITCHLGRSSYVTGLAELGLGGGCMTLPIPRDQLRCAYGVQIRHQEESPD